MGDDDAAARRERADRLRESIKEKIGSAPSPGRKPETPRDFVERRTRETEKKDPKT